MATACYVVVVTSRSIICLHLHLAEYSVLTDRNVTLNEMYKLRNCVFIQVGTVSVLGEGLTLHTVGCFMLCDFLGTL